MLTLKDYKLYHEESDTSLDFFQARVVSFFFIPHKFLCILELQEPGSDDIIDFRISLNRLGMSLVSRLVNAGNGYIDIDCTKKGYVDITCQGVRLPISKADCTDPSRFMIDILQKRQ